MQWSRPFWFSPLGARRSSGLRMSRRTPPSRRSTRKEWSVMKKMSVAFFLAVLPLSAMAQTTKGANGGDVVVMDGHPIEFVSRGQEIAFYILEDDAKSPTLTAGATARAVIQ